MSTEKAFPTEEEFEKTFEKIRHGLDNKDYKLANANIAHVKDLLERGGDWDRKNRLHCYEGLYKMCMREFKEAAELFLKVVPTFGATELMSYQQLIFYAVITNIYALDRPALQDKIIRCNEIQEQLNSGGLNGELDIVKNYLDAFYGCIYDKFYLLLAKLEEERLKKDIYLEQHYHFYSRAMRLKAYTQFLAPYKKVRLELMAKEFGVSKQFIDKELHAQVSAGHLSCRIDAVNEVVHITHCDSRNELFNTVIKTKNNP